MRRNLRPLTLALLILCLLTTARLFFSAPEIANSKVFALSQIDLPDDMGATTEGCSHPRNGYDQIKVDPSPTLLVLDNCQIRSQVFGFETSANILQVSSLGDLENGKLLGQATFFNAQFHFDDGGKVILEEEKPVLKMQLQCHLEKKLNRVFGVISYHQSLMRCLVLDELGTPKGRLLLTEK